MSPLLLPLLVALHAAPPSVVAPDWKTVQVPNDLAAFYSDHFAQELRGAGLKVVTSSEVSALLSMERQRQLLGCSDDSTSCVAELGAAMGCDAVLLVTLAKLEDTYQGNLKIVSSVDGAVLAETRVQATGQKALLDELDAAARRLAGPLVTRAKPAGDAPVRDGPVTTVTPPKSGGTTTTGGPESSSAARAWGGTKRFWWIPLAAAGAGVITAVAGYAVTWEQYNKMNRILSEKKSVTQSALDAAGEGKAAQAIGHVGLAVGLAGLAGMTGLLVFGSEPAVTPSVVTDGAGTTMLFVGGRL